MAASFSHIASCIAISLSSFSSILSSRSSIVGATLGDDDVPSSAAATAFSINRIMGCLVINILLLIAIIAFAAAAKPRVLGP